MTIYGWDMSHYDSSGTGNAVAQGIDFITHKAGGDAPDAELAAWWSGVRGWDPSQVLLGAYWVLYPDKPAARADAFLARLDAQCPGWRGRPFILQVDCERWNGDQGTVPSKGEIKVFCDRLVARVPKLRPIVYAPKWVYGDSLAGLGYPLWASSYVGGAGGFKQLYPGDGSSRWGSYSGQVPAVLQYSSSATIGGQTTCDANAFRGTLAELTKLVAPGFTINMEENVPLTNADADLIIDRLLARGVADPYQGVTQRLESKWRYIPGMDQIQAGLAPMFAELKAAIQASAVDPAALADSLTQAVLAALPADSDDISQEEVTNAVRTVVHEAFGGQPGA